MRTSPKSLNKRSGGRMSLSLRSLVEVGVRKSRSNEKMFNIFIFENC
jgi:hypothetical protein